jgi:hypothetical protein
MSLSEAQKDFLKNLIDFEITDSQNQFISNSQNLKNLINDIKSSIKLDQILIDQLKIDINRHFLFGSIFDNEQDLKKNNDHVFSQQTKFLQFLEKHQFNLRIFHSSFLGIKNFLSKRIEEKKEIKKIFEAALFIDLFDFFLRKFDVIHNSEFIIKIAESMNNKFNLEIFSSWIIDEQKTFRDFFPKKNEIHINGIKQSKFNQRFLKKITDFAEFELGFKKENYIKFLKQNNIKIERKKHHNVSNILNFFFDQRDDLFIFFDRKIIDLIQNYIDYFYLNEFANKNYIEIS